MIISELFEQPQQCPECGGISFSDLILAEKKDACYHKVKASAKVWPSAYASGRLVQCRKKGAANYGNKSEGVAEQQELDEKWSQKYKKSINCANPKGFSQKAHCAGRKKNEDVAEAGPLDQRRNLPPLTGVELGGSQGPQFRLPIIPDNMPGGARMPGGAGLSRNIATQRSVGGKEIPRLNKPGNYVPGTISDPALTKLGGKDVRTTSGPTVTVQPRGSEYEPLAVNVPAYVRQGKPDPVTVPKPGTKPKITVRPGETVPQAIERTKSEQEFGQFLRGQSGQTFGTPTTPGSNQVPTVKLPGGQTMPDPDRLSPSGQYNTQSGRKSIDQIERDDKIAVDAMAKRARQSVADRERRRDLDDARPGLDEQLRKKREQPEVEYDDEYDAMVARVRKLAGLGPMKTVYDPDRRVYRNQPTAVQPPRQSKK